MPTVRNTTMNSTANCHCESLYHLTTTSLHYKSKKDAALSTCYTLSSLLYCCDGIIASAYARRQCCLTTCCTVLTEHDGMDRNKEYTNTTSLTVLVKEREGMDNTDRKTQQNTAKYEYMSIRVMERTIPVQAHNGTTATNSLHVICCVLCTINSDVKI